MMPQMLCGTDPLPELFRAKRYKIHQKFLTKHDFQFIMRNLPVAVAEDDIDDMFNTADTDGDGKIGYKVNDLLVTVVYIMNIKEFQNMINPPKPPEGPKPTKALFKSLYQDVKAPISLTNSTHQESENNGIKDTPGMSFSTLDDQLSMQLNISSNLTETEVRQHSRGVKTVNFVANL